MERSAPIGLQPLQRSRRPKAKTPACTATNKPAPEALAGGQAAPDPDCIIHQPRSGNELNDGPSLPIPLPAGFSAERIRSMMPNGIDSVTVQRMLQMQRERLASSPLAQQVSTATDFAMWSVQGC